MYLGTVQSSSFACHFLCFPFFSPYYPQAMHYFLPWLEFLGLQIAASSHSSLLVVQIEIDDSWNFMLNMTLYAALHPSPFTKFKQAQLNQSIQAIFLGEYLLIFVWYQMYLKSWRYNCPWDNLSSMSLATILAAYWELVAMILLFYFFHELSSSRILASVIWYSSLLWLIIVQCRSFADWAKVWFFFLDQTAFILLMAFRKKIEI